MVSGIQAKQGNLHGSRFSLREHGLVSLAFLFGRSLIHLAGVQNLKRLFQPATEWHPLDKTDSSPHRQHREVLGGHETAYNRVVHGYPVAPLGLYAFVPLSWIWAFRRAKALSSAKSTDAVA